MAKGKAGGAGRVSSPRAAKAEAAKAREAKAREAKRDNYGRWLKSLTAEEREALRQYTQIDYDPINEYLRTGALHPSRMSEAAYRAMVEGKVARIRDALAKAPPTAADQVVYRGIEDVKATFGRTDIQALVGGTIHLKGFTSTSRSDRIAKTFRGEKNKSYTKITSTYPFDFEEVHLTGALLRIRVPKGTRRAAYVERVSAAKGEREFLLDHGHRLKITGARKNSKGQWDIDVTVAR